MTSSEEPQAIEAPTRDRSGPCLVIWTHMNMNQELYRRARKVAKYHNGLVVPRAMQIAAIRELQELIKLIDDQAASSDPSSPTEVQASAR